MQRTGPFVSVALCVVSSAFPGRAQAQEEPTDTVPAILVVSSVPAERGPLLAVTLAEKYGRFVVYMQGRDCGECEKVAEAVRILVDQGYNRFTYLETAGDNTFVTMAIPGLAGGAFIRDPSILTLEELVGAFRHNYDQNLGRPAAAADTVALSGAQPRRQS